MFTDGEEKMPVLDIDCSDHESDCEFERDESDNEIEEML